MPENGPEMMGDEHLPQKTPTTYRASSVDAQRFRLSYRFIRVQRACCGSNRSLRLAAIAGQASRYGELVCRISSAEDAKTASSAIFVA